jgi:uncharacterized protein YybS (DUF2232 family)
LVLVAVLTPVCWVGVLIGVRWVRRLGPAGPGLDGLLNWVEGYAWIAGAFLASVIVGLLVLLGVPFLVSSGR